MSCAIVTGASRGFGRAIARSLAEAGHPVVMAARGEAELRAAAASMPGPALPVAADVTDEPAVQRLVAAATDAFGEVEILVNNAGALPVLATLDELTWEHWRTNFDVDVRGIFNMTKATAMRRGTIVNVASGAAMARGALHVSYTPAQAAIVALSRCLDAWLEDVAVHCLSPTLSPDGAVGRTGATVFAAELGITSEEWLERHFGDHVMRGEQVGAAVVALTRQPHGGVWGVDSDGLHEEGVRLRGQSPQSHAVA